MQTNRADLICYTDDALEQRRHASYDSRVSLPASIPLPVLLIAAVFFLDVLVPDPVPFFDEILLGAGTLILAKLKQKVRNAAGMARSTMNEIDSRAEEPK